MKKFLALILALCMVLSLAACGESNNGAAGAEDTTNEATPETKYFTIGASPSTAGMYPYWVACGQTIQKIFPQYVMTVSESRGAADVSNRIRSDAVIMGNSVAKTDYENYYGEGEFEGDPNESARMLWYYGLTYYTLCVSQESGINSFSDLEGKRINTGGTGSTLSGITTGLLDTFGINCDIYEASKTDAGDAYSNRQIVGMPTASAIPDSFVLQLNASLPCKILSMTEEEQAKALEGHPYYVAVTVPAGSYEGQDEDVLTIGYMQGSQSSTALDQQDGYLFCVAMFDEGFDMWTDTWPQSATLDYCQMMLDSPIPLHAGTVQYLVEKGYDVPDSLIGPEYVPVD